MASRAILALGVVLVGAGAGGYLLLRPVPTAPIVGVVRATEVRLAPEVGGQLADGRLMHVARRDDFHVRRRHYQQWIHQDQSGRRRRYRTVRHHRGRDGGAR